MVIPTMACIVHDIITTPKSMYAGASVICNMVHKV